MSKSNSSNSKEKESDDQGHTSPEHRHVTGPARPHLQQYAPVEAAEEIWRRCIRDWYPNFHKQTYLVPPLYFNRVSYRVQTVARQSVLVPQKASDQPIKAPNVVPNDPSSYDPSLAAERWPAFQTVPPGPLSRVYDMDEREDDAMQQVINHIRYLAEELHEVMMVLFHLEFRKYLDNQVDPVTAAAIRLLPRPATLQSIEQWSMQTGNQSSKRAKIYKLHAGLQGDFDVLMITKRYGLIVGEVKSVGANLVKTPDLHQAVLKAVERAVKQLNKAEHVLKHLVADNSIRIIKALMLPNITSTQLLQALSTDPKLQQDLCQCVGVDTDTAAAVARCLTADSLTSSLWWQRAVTDMSKDTDMSWDLYEVIVARFCGPATSVEVPTIATPRRTFPLRATTDAVTLTGLTMAMLTLHPQQVELVSMPGLPRVFIWGPPGTGKTVILVLKGMQWVEEGKDVHLLSTHRRSRAATLLIERHLQHTLRTGSTSTSAPGPRIYTHFFDFDDKKGDVEAAVEKLASAARDGELFAIADEAFCGRVWDNTIGRFAEFCNNLDALVPALHLWAAAVMRDHTRSCLCVKKVTTQVRCPPSIHREVMRSQWIDDLSVPRYSSAAPAPTEGPALREIRHIEPGCGFLTPLIDHANGSPENCELCADVIADIMKELKVGQAGYDLQYRDTIILCAKPRDSLPMVTRLRAHGLPVKVVSSNDDVPVIRDFVLGVDDVVTMTEWKVVCGLERRVVVMLGEDGYNDRLQLMSRCTSLLISVGEPQYNNASPSASASVETGAS